MQHDSTLPRARATLLILTRTVSRFTRITGWRMGPGWNLSVLLCCWRWSDGQQKDLFSGISELVSAARL
jgi:hypothetical protein